MKNEYDVRKGRRNPYAKLLKRPVTIRLDQSTMAYFKKLAEDAGQLRPRPDGRLRHAACTRRYASRQPAAG